MKYRKKPVVIEAMQFKHKWAHDNVKEIASFIHDNGGKAEMSVDGYGEISTIKIITLEGPLLARPGDWIIKGVKGEFYPCKPDIFEKTYRLGADFVVEANIAGSRVETSD